MNAVSILLSVSEDSELTVVYGFGSGVAGKSLQED